MGSWGPAGFEVSCLFRVNSRLVASGFRTPNFRGSHTCAQGLLAVPCSCLPTLRPGHSVPKVLQASSRPSSCPFMNLTFSGSWPNGTPSQFLSNSLPLLYFLQSTHHFGKFLRLCVDVFSAGFPDAGMNPQGGLCLGSFPAPAPPPRPHAAIAPGSPCGWAGEQPQAVRARARAG